MVENNDHFGGGLKARVQRAWGPGPLQAARMNGPAPDRVLVRPRYPRTPSRALTQMLLAKTLTLGDEKIDLSRGAQAVWAKVTDDTPGIDALHGFEWLGGLVKAHTDELANPAHDRDLLTHAQNTALALTKGWLDHFERWSPQAWSPTRLADRLMHLCCHVEFLLTLGDSLWRSRLLTAMARQTRHLAQIAHKAAPGEDMLIAAMGLHLAGLCIPGCEVAIERGEQLTRRELRLQIRSDGGHLSRNPSLQLEIVIRLQMIAEAYHARTMPLPGHIKLTVSRMASLVEFFRCGDGKLAVFNGAFEDDTAAIIAVGKAIDPQAAPVGFARYTKYQRLSAARALVIADVGDNGTQDGATSKRRGSIYDSASSFQLSSGRTRIIVNCGNGDDLGGDWPRALRQAGAHSTFSLDGDPGIRDGLFAGETRFQRAEEVSGLLLEMVRPFSPRVVGDQTHAQAPTDDPNFTPGHFRRLYLAAGGDDLRGEDRLISLAGRFAPYWRLRFHLHPSVKASLARDGQSVILVLPNQEGWRFRTSHQTVRLEKSVYFGGEGRMAHTEQIVIGPAHADHLAHRASFEIGLDRPDSHDIIIKWAFRRLDGI